jgi:uncharacterized protein (DUF1697 family)
VTTYVALLRGINVGGNNVIRMVDLRDAFEGAGLARVRTYIQSGNVLFDSERTDDVALVDELERLLAERFSYAARLALASATTWREVVADAPDGFGTEPDVYRSDVYVTLPGLAPNELLAAMTMRDGVDTAEAGRHAVYTTRLVARASQSRFSDLVKRPAYRSITVRNWATTTRLAAMLDE